MVESLERSQILETVSWAVRTELEELQQSAGFVWVQELLGEGEGYMPELGRSKVDLAMDSVVEAYRIGNILENLLESGQCSVMLHEHQAEKLPFVGYFLKNGGELPVVGLEYGFVKGLNTEKLRQYIHWGLIGMYAYYRKNNERQRMRLISPQTEDGVIESKFSLDELDIRIREKSDFW